MNLALVRINSYFDHPFTSITGAISELSNKKMDSERYKAEIAELTDGVNYPTTFDTQHCKYLFLYVVQTMLQNDRDNVVANAPTVLSQALKQLQTLFSTHKNMLATEDDSPVTSTGTRRSSVGTGESKKVQAVAMYQKHFNPDDVKASHKLLKQMFQDDLDMTKVGATTYIYICRKALNLT